MATFVFQVYGVLGASFYITLLFFNTNYTQLFYLYTGLTPKIPRSSRAFQMFTKINVMASGPSWLTVRLRQDYPPALMLRRGRHEEARRNWPQKAQKNLITDDADYR